jgi:hypothetical protein
MKTEISLAALTHRNGHVLVEVVETLHLMRLHLESLIWSELPDTGEARIWLSVSAEEEQGPELLDIATLLHQLRLNPEALGWERTANGGGSVWFMLLQDDHHVRTMVEALQSADGVHRVVASIEAPDMLDLPPAATD